jgi:hypothetical protein
VDDGAPWPPGSASAPADAGGEGAISDVADEADAIGDATADAGADAGAEPDGGAQPDGGAEADEGSALETAPPGCNPLGWPLDCMFPFPSDFFTVADATTASGVRLSMEPIARPKTVTGAEIYFLDRFTRDGFSAHMPIAAVFPEGVDDTALTFHWDDPAPTVQPGHPTLLLRADTGEFVEHWAEVDPVAEEPSQRTLILRPFNRLEPGKRYVVALQGLSDEAGAPLQSPPVFARLRDGAPLEAETALAERFRLEVFAPLAAAGVNTAGLVLAWDFTVGTEENVTSALLWMRDDALERMAAAPPPVEVTAVKPDHSEDIALRIEGTIAAPRYVDSDEPGARLVRGPGGLPVYQGVAIVPFTLQVPRSAMPDAPGFEPARVLQYGHGFFGAREEINYGFMSGFSNEQRYVTAAVDWWGMSEADVPLVVESITGEIANTFDFVERLHQGYINQLALSVALETTLAALPELQAQGALVYDPTRLYWYGISQGSILGTVLVALSPHFERAAVSVGGASYSLMMSRSGSFLAFYTLISAMIDSPLSIQKLIASSQLAWDYIDPITFAPFVAQRPLEGAKPGRRLLYQIGVGDHSVPNLASHLHVRAMGLPLLSPSPVAITGVATVNSPAPGSAMVVVDYQLEEVPGIFATVPSEAEKNGVHEDVRRNPAIKAQLDAFFRPDSAIENFCDGPCDPE